MSCIGIDVGYGTAGGKQPCNTGPVAPHPCLSGAPPGLLRGARLEMAQRVLRDDTVLFTAQVTLVALGPTGRPARLPDALRGQLAPKARAPGQD